jgi:adenylate kinase
MRVAITGTPGCGKTTVAKILAKKIHFRHLNINRLIKSKKLYSGFDKKRKAYIADVSKIKRFLKTVEGNVILDSHLSHMLNPDVVFVLRCRPDVLVKRMKKRKWCQRKINENMEAEMIGLILWEAKKSCKKVFEIDTTKKTPSQAARKIESLIKKISI